MDDLWRNRGWRVRGGDAPPLPPVPDKVWQRRDAWVGKYEHRLEFHTSGLFFVYTRDSMTVGDIGEIVKRHYWRFQVVPDEFPEEFIAGVFRQKLRSKPKCSH